MNEPSEKSADEIGEDTWSRGSSAKGALMLPNCDDDNQDGIPDNWTGVNNRYGPVHLPPGDWDLDGTATDDPANDEIDGGGDLDDLAELWVHTLGVDWGGQGQPSRPPLRITLKVAKVPGEDSFFGNVEPQDRIRIFLPTDDTTEQGNLICQTADQAIIGPEAGPEVVFIGTALDIFEGDGIVKFRVEGIELGAMVDITLTVEDTGRNLLLDSDTVRMRVAPFVMSDHDMPVSTTGGASVFVQGTVSAELVSALEAKYGTSGQVDKNAGDWWPQDGFEVGYARVPGVDVDHPIDMSVFFTSPRIFRTGSGLAGYVHNQRLGPGIGVCSRMEYIPYGWHGWTSYDKCGNLESIPNSTGPGHLFYGRSLHTDIQAFFRGQGVNPLFPVNTDWLDIGHVDEVISFVPLRNGPTRYTVVADPEVCWALLKWLNNTAGAEVAYYPVSVQLSSDNRSLNLPLTPLSNSIMEPENLPSIREALGLDSPETPPTGTGALGGTLIKGGAFTGWFPDNNRRYYLVKFTSSSTYDVYSDTSEIVTPQPDQKDPTSGSVGDDCIFEDAMCFVFSHWWNGSFATDDVFRFEADPTCTTIEMPVLFKAHTGTAPEYTGFSVASTIDHANCFVDGTYLLIGDPGDEYSSTTAMTVYVKALLQRAGYEHPPAQGAFDPMVDSQSYHNTFSNVHCGTNTRRACPPVLKWWE